VCCWLQALKPCVCEGDEWVNAVQTHGETASEHTGRDGQHELRQLMNTARDDWTEAVNSLSVLTASLEDQLQAWTELDKHCEELRLWLTETEACVKNVEMRSTVVDKQAAVTQLSVSRT